jgi:mannosyltransferase
VPLLAMFLLGFRKPVYNPKFALLALPGFLLLLAAGLAAARRVGVVAGALLLAASGYALHNYYANPEFARDDYRGVARFISTSQRPGDAVLLDAPGQEQIFPYYYAGGLPLIGLPNDRPLNADKTSQQLASLNGEYKRLWLVLYGTNGSDPDSYVEKWLASKDFEIQNQWFGNVRLTAFAAPAAGAQATGAVNATIGGFAQLRGYSLTPPAARSGDVWQLGLQWRAVAPAPGDVKVFTHVIDNQGNIWAQRDSDPAGGARPTGGWHPGETIDDNYGLLVLPGTPPGQYQIEAGMYTPADAKRLPITAGGEGDRVIVVPDAAVSAARQPPSIDELRIPHPLERQFGGFSLLGYGRTLVGQDAERDSFAAGDDMHLTLFWQADQPRPSDAQWMLRLGANGQVLGSGTLVQQHPTSTWHPGERYRDQYRLHLPADAEGDFELDLAIDGRDATPVGRIHIR